MSGSDDTDVPPSRPARPPRPARAPRAAPPSPPSALSHPSALGHALAGTLFVLFATMAAVQDVVAALGGATRTLLAVHVGTLAGLTWMGAQTALFSEAIERRDGRLLVRRVSPGDVVRRIAGRWRWRAPALLALHLVLGWLGQ